MSKKQGKRVSVCLIRDWQDNILMGKRNDNQKYTNPGGHCEDGECAYQACIRECKEETGLDAVDTKLVKVSMNGNIMIYVFEVKVDLEQEIDTSQDPDNECDSWEYVDPNDVRDELHVPIQDNILLKYWINN